jgi:hypothetical protein
MPAAGLMREAGRPSLAGGRCGKLLLASIEESLATPKTTGVGRALRSASPVTGSAPAEGALARRYQPDRPITNRPPAPYRDSTITKPPNNPPKKNRSGNAVSDASRDTRLSAPHHLSNALRHRRPARHRPSHREDARPEHLQETRRRQTSRSSEAERAGLLPQAGMLMSGNDLHAGVD